jgi:predicted RNase H-like nuclease (RuvC/YqgF family)
MPDGTPTGGLDGLNQVRDLNLAGSADVGGTQSAYPRDAEVEPLTSRIENLQAENDRLRRELTENRSASTGPAGAAVLTSEQAEIERLRTLVSRLERALADSNLRFRNLQQKLDESK